MGKIFPLKAGMVFLINPITANALRHRFIQDILYRFIRKSHIQPYDIRRSGLRNQVIFSHYTSEELLLDAQTLANVAQPIEIAYIITLN